MQVAEKEGEREEKKGGELKSSLEKWPNGSMSDFGVPVKKKTERLKGFAPGLNAARRQPVMSVKI